MASNLISASKFENKPLPEFTDDDVLISGSHMMLILTKNEDTKAVYSNFNDNYLEPFINTKLPADLKTIIQAIYKRDIVYLGVHPKSNSNVLGHYVTNHDNLAGIILNTSMLDIDTTTGECNEPDSATLVVYQQFIRYIVATNYQKIKANDDLHSDLISYYMMVIKKYLELNTMNEKQQELFAILVTVVYYKHFLQLDHKSACSKIKGKFTFSDLKSVLTDPNLVKATHISHLTKLVVDYRLFPEAQSPNALTFKLLTKLKIIPYLSITSDLGYLISSVIIANQNLIHFQSLKVSPNIQSSIERQIQTMFGGVTYDSTAIKKVKLF